MTKGDSKVDTLLPTPHHTHQMSQFNINGHRWTDVEIKTPSSDGTLE